GVQTCALPIYRESDVLEVGPGLGVLTGRLAKLARQLVAVEVDPHLADWLQTELAGYDNVTVCAQDILKVDPSSFFERAFVVVANLPYHITSPALRHLLASGPPYASRLVVMVQAEVAERISATPGQMSALAVTLQAQARIQLVRRVPSAAFYPRPKVDSAVLLLEPLPDAERAIARSETAAFTELVRAGFKQPRKTLANSLAEGLRRRDDGYHDLASLVHTVSLADDLRIELANELLTRVEGLDIDPETNLVARAAERLVSATGRGSRVGAELSLVKRIPAAAGLGGGSSDAATTLVGLNALWDTRLGLTDLVRLAAELGSDVPFFIRG